MTFSILRSRGGTWGIAAVIPKSLRLPDGGDVVLSVPALSAGVLTITTIRTK